jgi:hypothetical protein
LDAEFAARFGDVSAFLDTHGYNAYAAENVRLYSALPSVRNIFRVTAPYAARLSPSTFRNHRSRWFQRITMRLTSFSVVDSERPQSRSQTFNRLRRVASEWQFAMSNAARLLQTVRQSTMPDRRGGKG